MEVDGWVFDISDVTAISPLHVSDYFENIPPKSSVFAHFEVLLHGCSFSINRERNGVPREEVDSVKEELKTELTPMRDIIIDEFRTWHFIDEPV